MILEFDSGVRISVLANSWGTASDRRSWVTTSGSNTKTTITQLQFYNSAESFGVIGTNNNLDCIITARIVKTVTADTPGLLLRYTDVNNFIKLDFSSGSLRIRKRVAGVNTNVVTTAVTMNNSTNYWFKMQVIGTTYSAKFWQDGTTEPDWMLSGTASDPALQRGLWGLYGSPTTSAALSFDSFSVSSVVHTPVSDQDQNIYKFQIVKVYDPTGLFIDVIRDAPLLSFQENINAAASTVTMTLSRSFDAYDGLYQPGSKNTIAKGNIVQWWIYGAGLPSSGLLKYAGRIDEITPKIGEDRSESINVLVTSWSQIAFGDHGVTTAITFGTVGDPSTYIDTGAIFRSFFTGSYIDRTGTTISTMDATTGKPYADPYTLDASSTSLTGNETQIKAENQPVVNALSNVVLLSPTNYYFRPGPDQIAYFGPIPTDPKHILLLGKHISSIEYSQSNIPRKNLIIVQGNGVQGKYIGSSISTIGQRFYGKSDNRITDVATAQALADGLGAMLDRDQIRAKVKIPDYRGDQLSGLGYDIETFMVGQPIKIIDARAPTSSITGQGMVWGSAIWGGDKWGSSSNPAAVWGSFTWGNVVWGSTVGSIFNTVVTIVSIQYDFFSCTLEIGFRAPTLNRKIYEIQTLLQDATLV
jgi:hypothetical protein